MPRGTAAVMSCPHCLTSVVVPEELRQELADARWITLLFDAFTSNDNNWLLGSTSTEYFDPLSRTIADGRYRRTVLLGGRPGWLEVRHLPDRQALALTLHHPDPTALQEAAARVRQVFDLGADPHAVRTTLAKDALLKPLVTRNPGLRIPGAWDAFELGVRAILGQQVSVAAATRLAARIAQAHGQACEAPGLSHLFPTPEALAALAPEALPLPRQRAVAIVTFAQEVASGRLALGGTALPEETLAALAELPGMGPWTVQYFALRALAEPDAFPSGDLVLRQVVGGGTAVTPKQLEARAESWRPWRAYAALHLWSQA